MWLSGLFLIFGFLWGSHAFEEYCDTNPVTLCMPQDRPPLSFPETEDTLEEVCKTVIQLYECMYRQAKTCGFEHMEEMEGYKIKMLKFVCNKDNPIFYEIARNLGCLKTVAEEYDQELCYKLVLRTKEKLNQNEWQKIYDLFTKGNDTEEETDLRSCYNIAFENACTVVQVSNNCGVKAKEIAQRALAESNMLEEVCQPKAAETVNTFESILNMEADKM